jgi:hypothetical protein
VHGEDKEFKKNFLVSANALIAMECADAARDTEAEQRSSFEVRRRPTQKQR